MLLSNGSRLFWSFSIFFLLTTQALSGPPESDADKDIRPALLVSGNLVSGDGDGPPYFSCLLEMATQSLDGKRLPIRFRFVVHRYGSDFRVLCLDHQDRLGAVFFRKGALLIDDSVPGKVVAVNDGWLGLSYVQKGIPIFLFAGSKESSKFLVDRRSLFTGLSGIVPEVRTLPGLVRYYQNGDRTVREISAYHGNRREVVAIERTTTGASSFQLMRVLSFEGRNGRGTKSIDPASLEWSRIVSRRISSAELDRDLFGSSWMDDDPRYTQASVALADLVGLTDATLLRRFEALPAAGPGAEFTSAMLSLLDDGFLLNHPEEARDTLKSPHVVRTCYRANLELSVGARRISEIVQRLLDIVEQENAHSTRMQALYLLSRLGLSTSESRRLDDMPIPGDLQADVTCVNILSGLPADLDAWRSQPVGILEALLQIETAFLLEQPIEQSAVDLLLASPRPPVCAAERERILTMLFQSKDLAKRIHQAVVEKSCPAFTAVDCVSALKRGGDVESWTMDKTAADVIISLCDMVVFQIQRLPADAHAIRTEALRLMGRVSVLDARHRTGVLFGTNDEADRRVGVEGSRASWFTRDEFAVQLKHTDDSDSIALRRSAIAAAAGAVAEQIQKKDRDIQLPYLFLVRALTDKDRDVRNDALAALVNLTRDVMDVPDAVVERAIKALDGESEIREVKLVAALVRQNTPFLQEWPPLRDEIPLEPFEEEDQWWARNRDKLVLLLQELLQRLVAAK